MVLSFPSDVMVKCCDIYFQFQLILDNDSFMEVMEGKKCPSTLKDGNSLLNTIDKYHLPSLSKTDLLGVSMDKTAINRKEEEMSSVNESSCRLI